MAINRTRWRSRYRLLTKSCEHSSRPEEKCPYLLRASRVTPRRDGHQNLVFNFDAGIANCLAPKGIVFGDVVSKLFG
jgi:hypothetical protein